MAGTVALLKISWSPYDFPRPTFGNNWFIGQAFKNDLTLTCMSLHIKIITKRLRKNPKNPMTKSTAAAAAYPNSEGMPSEGIVAVISTRFCTFFSVTRLKLGSESEVIIIMNLKLSRLEVYQLIFIRNKIITVLKFSLFSHFMDTFLLHCVKK